MHNYADVPLSQRTDELPPTPNLFPCLRISGHDVSVKEMNDIYCWRTTLGPFSYLLPHALR